MRSDFYFLKVTTCLERYQYLQSIISECELQAAEKIILLPIYQRSLKGLKTFLGRWRVMQRQVVRHFTRNGTDQCQKDSSNTFTPDRAQPRSTRTVVVYLRPALSAITREKNDAPIFILSACPYFLKASPYRNNEIVPRPMAMEVLS